MLSSVRCGLGSGHVDQGSEVAAPHWDTVRFAQIDCKVVSSG